MRIPYVLLAILLFAVFAAAGVMVFVSSPRGGAVSSVSKREIVYVDASRLLVLHPSARALAMMQSVASDIRSVRYRTIPFTQPSGGLRSAPVPLFRPTTPPRQRLEAEVAQKAVSALAELEADQRAALRTRLAATRESMMRSAESELTARTREIRNEASEQLQVLARSYASERVNAQIKVDALGHAKAGVKLVMSPMGGQRKDPEPLLVAEPEPHSNPKLAAIESELRGVQAELARIIDVTSAETDAIQAEARRRIEDLRAQSAATVDSYLATQEEGERRRIEERITSARADVMRELGILEAAGRPSGSARTRPLPVGRAAVVLTEQIATSRIAGVDTRELTRAVEDLRRSMLADVREAVRKLARDKGVAVTFARQEAAPDRTRMFAEILRDKGWVAYGAVLCARPS